MDIHPPDEPIHSWKGVLIHLCIVTIGILIALSLEGLLEWSHHKELVREAKANIRSELQDNKKELDYVLKAIPETRKKQSAALGFIRDILEHRSVKTGEISLGANRSEISDSSWITARTVGATEFMDYQDVKKYARVYELQDEFLRLQDKTLDAVTTALTILTNSQDPTKLPPRDLESEQLRIREALAALMIEEQFGQTLQKRYAELLR